MGSQIVTLDECPACGWAHADLPTHKCAPDMWIEGHECVRFAVCPQEKRTIYLSHERGQLIGLLKDKEPEAVTPPAP